MDAGGRTNQETESRSPRVALQRTSVAYTDLGKGCTQEQLISTDEQQY